MKIDWLKINGITTLVFVGVGLPCLLLTWIFESLLKFSVITLSIALFLAFLQLILIIIGGESKQCQHQ